MPADNIYKFKKKLNLFLRLLFIIHRIIKQQEKEKCRINAYYENRNINR